MKLCFNYTAYFSKLDYRNMLAIGIRDKRHGTSSYDGPLENFETAHSKRVKCFRAKAPI